MRSFISGSGTDVTSQVIAYLAAHRQLLCADLLQLQTAVQGESWSQNLLFTMYDRPLTWAQKGTFIPGRFSRGEIPSQIGLDTVSMNLDWYLRDLDVFVTAPGGVTITQLQAFERGLWDNGLVSVYRTVMPAVGDADTYGAVQLFGGRIAEVTKLTRTGVTLKINSLLELLDQYIPTNLIEATNIQCQYGTGMPPGSLSALPVFTVASGSTTGTLLATCASPNSGQVFASDTFDFGYLQFNSGSSLGKIFRSVWMSKAASGQNVFYLYDALPWLPAVGEQFTAYVPAARASTQLISEQHTVPSSSPYAVTVTEYGLWVSDEGVTGNSASYTAVAGVYTFQSTDAGKTVTISYLGSVAGYQGFPYVPSPEVAA